MVIIKTAKNGRKYKILRNGQARFIKMSSKRRISKKSRTKPVRSYTRMAKKRTYKSKKSTSMLGISMSDVWKGVGAGSAGLVGGVMNQFVPQLGGNLATGAGGLLISYMGKGPIKNIGKGLVISSIAGLVEENVMPSIMGRIGVGNTGGASNSTIYG